MFWKKEKKKLVKMARKLVTIANGHSFISEQFRTIRTNITFQCLIEKLKQY